MTDKYFYPAIELLLTGEKVINNPFRLCPVRSPVRLGIIVYII